MNDALIVRRLERLGDLSGDVHGLVKRQRSATQPLREILARHELHDEEARAAVFVKAVDPTRCWDD